jgi:hypothetical protein
MNFGIFPKQVIVIDDFYPDPDVVRNIALDMQYEEPGKRNYPGVMSEDRFWTEEHTNMFRYITNHNVNPIGGSSLCGKFRLTKADDEFTQFIHFDPGTTIWAGIVYLTPDNYTNGIDAGTSFWKHKRTGLDSIPFHHEATKHYGLGETFEQMRGFLETEGCDVSKWERRMNVPIKYNRLVLFRPWLFHSSGIQFGTNKYDCRLIQLVFLEDANAK